MKKLMRYNRSVKSEALSSLLLISSTILALIIANSPYKDLYTRLINTSGVITNVPLNQFINEFLMFFFFFNVGLEIKENILFGNLSTIKKASFPIIGSIGGVIVPAVIFIFFNLNINYIKGFCIPISTDIAFAVGIFYIFKNHLNPNSKLFLLTLAVVDDLISILVIAVFFTNNINIGYFYLALCIVLLLIIANKVFHVEIISYYIFAGFILWYFVKISHIHPTISGILLALTIPAIPYDKKLSTLKRVQMKLVPFTNYIVIPLFAFVNSGITLDISKNIFDYRNLYLGIFLGLSVGKPLGITLFTYIFSKLKVIELPKNLNFNAVFSVSLIAGIGFTMSIFMCELTFSYDLDLVNICKFAILSSCLCSVIMTSIFILLNKIRKT